MPYPLLCIGGSFVDHPKDFNSYVLINDTSNYMMRPIIAFECTFEPESNIRPRITWQECRSTEDCIDILETTEPVNSGAQSNIPKYVFFQSGHTGYFQINDRNNETLNGASYRCKASSTLTGDTAELFSDQATVTFHAAGKHILQIYNCEIGYEVITT